MTRQTILLIQLLLLLCPRLFAQGIQAEKIELSGSKLENFYRIDKGVYRSEQPDEEDFKALERFGIREVLNLRYWHSDDDEARGRNLQLHRVRTSAHNLELSELIEALRIVKQRKGNILIHCKHGSDRTGAVCALYRMVFQNVPKAAAIKEMKEGGFGFHRIYRNIVRMLEEADISQVRQAVFAE
ncbi:dual specificity protein phosphatase family protein [Porphyromonas loveana]|uniref:dual specificity protein phosphatase family protein n=1 Tax=Porphyromonas loveana TaxID=1884669 RepID=UPI00359FC0AD